VNTRISATGTDKGDCFDVSACMPWCCEDEATDASEQLLQLAARFLPLHVPSLWPWEMMNAVAVACRRGRIPIDRASQFFEQIAAFDIRIAPAPPIADFTRISELAARFKLTAYDAAYLDLARQLRIPLATLDADLRKAATSEGVQTV
jgi:predicted nucleic acid-binding protein